MRIYDPLKLISSLNTKLETVIGLFGQKFENFTNTPHDKLLTQEDCMEILKCTERTLRYYIYEKKSLQPTRIGRKNMVKESEIKRFIKLQTRNFSESQ